MPFPNVRRAISVFLECLGDRGFFERQLLMNLSVLQLLKREVSSTGQPIRQMQPGRVLSGHDTCACWRTDMASRIGLGKPHAVLGETIDVGRFIETAAVASQITPTQIVDQEEHDVCTTFICPRCKRQQECQRKRRDEETGFVWSHGGSLC